MRESGFDFEVRHRLWRLCKLGRQQARENVVGERSPVYSGMMSYEKAVRELSLLGFMFEMPIVVAGVGVSGA